MEQVTKRPNHLWLVGILSTAWSAFGCFDYLMTTTRNAAYLSGFTAEQRAYFDSFPSTMVALWALGVWGALAGSLLLLARSRHAVTAFVVSLVGLVGSTAWSFTMGNVPDAFRTPGMLAMNAVIWAVAIGLLIYAWKMRARRVLR